jgi:serine phosphatase RsbU (regulator of sigma subunit)/anti-sigma regulatory factor (Ser/Thr protein kinase)
MNPQEVIAQYHQVMQELARGNSEPLEAMFSHRDDVTFASNFGPAVRGSKQVRERIRPGTARGSEIMSFECLAEYVTSDLITILEIEQWRTAFGDSEELVPYHVRATSTFRREDDTWKLVSRHTDPIGDLHPGLEEYVRRQQAEARERERIEQEMRVAQVIQQNFLPKALPDLPGWEFAAHYQPAREVGGDFYDFIELPDGVVGIVVGDVTGKGVPAAMMMASTRSVLRAAASRLVSPGEVLQRVNDAMCPDMPSKMFVTCLYGVLNPESGQLRFANAGHDLPYVNTAQGIVELRARGMPLGLMPGMSYEEKEATLEPGDSVLLHSDGIAEAHDPGREMFGFARLKETMAEAPAGQQLIDRVLHELEVFTGAGAEQEDDITMVSLRRVSASSGGGVLVEFEVPSMHGNERGVIERVERAVGGLGLESARVERLKTAVGEATMNAMEHGNEYRADRPVSVRVLRGGGCVRVQIADRGGAGELAGAEAPDLEAKLEGRQQPRGWGLFLIEKMVDEVRVTTDGDGRTVELVVHLEEGEDGPERGKTGRTDA